MNSSFAAPILFVVILAAPLTSAVAPQTVGGKMETLYSTLGDFAFEDHGNAVCAPGDLSGDGKADYLVSAENFDQSRGRVTAYSGLTGAILWQKDGEAPYDKFGRALTALHDLDGDGIKDLAVSAPFNDSSEENAGKIYVLSGATGVEIWTVTSPTWNRWLGTSLGAADINGDGEQDVIAGMPSAWSSDFSGQEAGKISAYSGANGSFLGHITGRTGFTNFGHSIANVGDYDGDGCEDIAVGSPGYDGLFYANTGRVQILSGSGLDDNRERVLGVLYGLNTNDKFGHSIDVVGDLNQDDYQELLIGSPYSSRSGVSASGKAQLFNGYDLVHLNTFQEEVARESAYFGAAVSKAGDVDHDGTPDFLISAPNDGWSNQGIVSIYSGQSFEPIAHLENGFSFGKSIAGLGDVNGDGTSEILCGAPYQNARGLHDVGEVHLYSLTPYLSLDSLTASPGDSVALQVDFPGETGFYQVLVSTAGQGSLILGSIEVPLSGLSVGVGSGVYPAFAQGMIGSLDAEGCAQASLQLPPGISLSSLRFAAIHSNDGVAIERSSIVQVLTIE